MKIIFNFFMFRDVPGCSGMFRHVPGFIDGRFIGVEAEQETSAPPPEASGLSRKQN